LPVVSPWRAAAILLLAISRQLAGDLDGADLVLARAVEVAEDAGTTETASVALAVRATLAMDRKDWNDAEGLAERASSIVHDAGLDDYVTSTLLYAVRARLAIHRRDVAEAREDLERAERLRPRLAHAVPFYAVQTQMALIGAQIALMDVRGAKDLLREVNDVLCQRPDLVMFREQADQLGARIDTIRRDLVGASPLTAAELRLLPHLATHHSFREIGEALHLSPHTVKTQAIAIYRKFGVSSRSHTIERAQDLGLLIR
jgi:LuxR family transcriptional regulator, maltose regulon positive regulatory protein